MRKGSGNGQNVCTKPTGKANGKRRDRSRLATRKQTLKPLTGHQKDCPQSRHCGENAAMAQITRKWVCNCNSLGDMRVTGVLGELCNNHGPNTCRKTTENSAFLPKTACDMCRLALQHGAYSIAIRAVSQSRTAHIAPQSGHFVKIFYPTTFPVFYFTRKRNVKSERARTAGRQANHGKSNLKSTGKTGTGSIVSVQKPNNNAMI